MESGPAVIVAVGVMVALLVGLDVMVTVGELVAVVVGVEVGVGVAELVDVKDVVDVPAAGVLVGVEVAADVRVLVVVEVMVWVEVKGGVKVAVEAMVLVGVGEAVEVTVGVWDPEAVEAAVLVGVEVAVPEAGTGVFVGAGLLPFEGVVGLLLLEQPVKRAENRRRGRITKAPRKGMAGKWDRLELCFILKPSGRWVEWISADFAKKTMVRPYTSGVNR